MIGREAPLDFFRRSGIPDSRRVARRDLAHLRRVVPVLLFVYTWKGGTQLNEYFAQEQAGFPSACRSFGDVGAGRLALTERGAPAQLLLHARLHARAICLFGFRRIRRRNTPYVTRQTLTLMAVQMRAAVPAARDHPAVARPRRRCSTLGASARRSPTTCFRRIRPRARILARLRLDPGVAADRLERVHRQPLRLVAGDRLRADVRADPAASSGAGARAPTAAGSARAARWPRRWATRSGRRCRTARGGTALNMVGQAILAVAFVLFVAAHRRLVLAGRGSGRSCSAFYDSTF